jgi:hypothetical protein
MRSTVLGPLVLIRNGQQPRGVRKLEKYGVQKLEDLQPNLNNSLFNDRRSSLLDAAALLLLFIEVTGRLTE